MKVDYETLVVNKDRLYSEYKAARHEAKEYTIIKQNVDSLLSNSKEQKQRMARFVNHPYVQWKKPAEKK